jgi:hypothetical protein
MMHTREIRVHTETIPIDSSSVRVNVQQVVLVEACEISVVNTTVETPAYAVTSPSLDFRPRRHS